MQIEQDDFMFWPDNDRTRRRRSLEPWRMLDVIGLAANVDAFGSPKLVIRIEAAKGPIQGKLACNRAGWLIHSYFAVTFFKRFC